MKIELNFSGKKYSADLSKPIDISIPFSNDSGPNCFGAPPFKATPLTAGSFIGSTKSGSPVNFYNVLINPHGNGTHTECLGHISDEFEKINSEIKNFHFIGKLLTVKPDQKGEDFVIGSSIIENVDLEKINTLIIRTLPNSQGKKIKNYTGTNPPYFHDDFIRKIVNEGIEHLLIDLPSVDKEKDGGLVQGHKTYWNYPHKNRRHCTITEMVYIPDEVTDGIYFVNLQFAPFDLDASPSKPVLYEMVVV